jgi:ADP-ribose pyrophosphatase YjhB (NUDIX family)
MTIYNFCTVCGNRLAESLLPTENRPRLMCTNCGHIQYINPKVVSGTLPVRDGRVWLLRRGIEPRHGYWTYPAGFQEWDESTEEAALRETLEEIGCEVLLDGLLGVYSRAGAPVVNVVYLAHFAAPGGVPCATTEAIEVRAFAPEEIPWGDLAFPSTQEVLRDWAGLMASQRRSEWPSEDFLQNKL